MSEQYDVYRPAGIEPTPPVDGGWQVLVEFSAQGQAKPPTKIAIAAHGHATHDEALEEAQRMAFEHQPPDPAMPQGRQVYRDSDGFLTIIQGAMSTFHFSTRVVRMVGVRDA